MVWIGGERGGDWGWGGGAKGGEVESLSQKNTFIGWGNLHFVEKQTKLSTKKFWRRANARNISLEYLDGGQFTLSTQLLKLNYPVILSHQCSTTVSLGTYPLKTFDRLIGPQCHKLRYDVWPPYFSITFKSPLSLPDSVLFAGSIQLQWGHHCVVYEPTPPTLEKFQLRFILIPFF